MRSRIRYALILILVVIVVGGLPPIGKIVHAVESCRFSELSSADCQLITDASNNLIGMKNFVMDYKVSFQGRGLPDGNVRFSSSGIGPVDITGINADKLLETLSQAIFASKLNSSLTIGTKAQSGTLDLRMIEGYLYLKGDRILQDPGVKVDLSKLLPLLPNQSSNALTAKTLNFDGLGGIVKTGGIDIAGVYHVRSQPGRTVEGQPTTQISLDINLYALFTYLTVPENRERFRKAMQANAQKMTDEQIDDLIRFMPLFKSTLQATKIQETWLIGKKDKLYHGWGLTFSTTVDPLLIKLLSGQTNNDPIQPIVPSGNMLVTLTKIGQPVTVQPIDGALDITDALLRQLRQGSGGTGGAKRIDAPVK